MKTFQRNRLCLTHQQVLTGQVTILQFLMIFRQHQTNPIVEPRILTENVLRTEKKLHRLVGSNAAIADLR